MWEDGFKAHTSHAGSVIACGAHHSWGRAGWPPDTKAGAAPEVLLLAAAWLLPPTWMARRRLPASNRLSNTRVVSPGPSGVYQAGSSGT